MGKERKYIRINQPLKKPKSIEGVPPFLSDGTLTFLYYYQSARTNWNYLVFSFLASVNADAIIPAGTATTPRPITNIKPVKIFPPAVIG